MSHTNYITSYCSIKSGKVLINNTIDYSDATSDNSIDFLKSTYKHYQLNYPKFYKMDNLCKLAFITSELLLKSNKVTEKYKSEDIAIIIANSASSLEIDTEHQSTISDKNSYFPSPAVFVYTLPNILIGEIAIRNSIKGENTFFIFDKFDADFMSSYIDSLLNSNKAQCCIAGWVDFYENNYESFLYTVEKQAGSLNIENTKEQLNTLHYIKTKIMDALIDQLKGEIIEQLNLEDLKKENIDNDAPLFGEGLGLDSIDALELIVLLEKNHGIKIANPADGKKIFQSVRTMAEFIQANKK